jgi:hypothetical protein
MTIKLLTLMSGPAGVFQPGLHQFDAATEKALIEGGYAEPVSPPVKREAETATPRPGENTAQVHTTRRQRRS